jgi:5-methylcytosine-specific restriction endonuclease McrA
MERKLKRAAAEMGLPLTVEIGMRRKRFLRCAIEQDYACFLCGEPLAAIAAATPERRWLKVSVDHLFPSARRKLMRALSNAGMDLALNLVAAHARCNQRKRNRLPTEAELERFAALKKLKLDKLLEIRARYLPAVSSTAVSVAVDG